MSRRILLLALVSSALAVASPGSAAAQDRPRAPLPIDLLATEVGAQVDREPEVRTGFSVDPPGAYEVHVRTAGDAVLVSVGREEGRRRAVETRYLARGVARPERLRASFGKLGEISMRFRESKHRPWFGKKRRCRGAGRFVVRRGIFVGSFRFRGEDGYLAIHIHRAKGAISTVAAKCRGRDRRRSARSSSSLFEDTFSGLIATDRDGVDSTEFLALSFRGEIGYFAQREENRGRLAILRRAIVVGRGELPLNEAVTAGKFSPSAPFHGTARYRAAPDGSTSWLGDLTVDFPGAPRFPLAGPTYETFLEAAF
jgi:hypothetical protein